MSQRKLNGKEKRTIAYMISLISQIGISMIVPIFLCLFIGIKINNYIDKSIVIVVSLIVGCGVAYRNAYMLLKQTYASDMKREHEELEYYKSLERARLENQKRKENEKQSD